MDAKSIVRRKALLVLLGTLGTIIVYGRPAFTVGYGCTPIDGRDGFFSLALQGYGHPSEGRYTLEWEKCGRVEVNEAISFFGSRNGLYGLSLEGDLFRRDSDAWNKQCATNQVTLLAGAVPDSYKLLCADEKHLYGLTLENHLAVSGLDGSERQDCGPSPDAVVLAASDSQLFAITPANDLYARSSERGSEWKKCSTLPFEARSAAWHNGRLYLLASDQTLWEGNANNWKVAAYLNGVTWKEPMKYIAISEGQLYGMGFDGNLFRSSSRSTGDLFARTIAVSDGKTTVALVSLDLGAIGIGMVDEIKRELESRFGLKRNAVMISVTHTHFAPAGMDWEMFPGGYSDPRYLSILKQAVVNSVGQALSDMKPSSASIFRSSANIGYNRGLTGEDAKVDPLVDCVCFNSTDNRKVLFFEAACHPVFPNSGLDRFTMSANFPGVARDRIETERPEVSSVFFQGCCGDTNPLSSDYRETGKELSDVVIKAMSGPSKPLKGRIKCKLDSISVPVQTMSRSQVVSFLERNQDRSLDIEAVKNVKWAKKMLAAYDRGDVRSTMTVYYQIIDIGSWRIVALSREPVKEYALRIRKLWPKKQVTVLGYTSDVSSYLTDDLHVETGTYESYDSFFWYGAQAPFPKGTLDLVVSTVAKQK